MTESLPVGATGEKTERVTHENTAIKHGSGSLPVYATPAMVALMEGACVNAVAPHLAEGTSTVGIDLKIKHTAATPVGLTVRAVGELVEIDDKEQIGSGTHERFIIAAEKFLQKAEAKKAD